ncbi:MAG: hypothetical protein LBK18_08145 [Prevotellaceae bacterium]|jgi:hypothetical protein|nr:hypothetical protein [Prevotellaceae bacterium]
MIKKKTLPLTLTKFLLRTRQQQSPCNRVTMTETEMSNLLKANSAYNKELKKYIRGTLPRWKVLDLGTPFGELSKHIDCTSNILMPQRVFTKAQKGHTTTINLKQLEDLPIKLNQASSIFQSKKDNSVVAVINEKDNKNNPIVIPINKQGIIFDGKKNRCVNLITSIHGRPQDQLELWTKNGLNLYSIEKTFIHPEQLGAIPSVEMNKGFKDTANVTPKSEPTKILADKMADLTKKKY